MQVVLTRDNSSIPWGFRLKGGAEYNVPLSILKVTEGSPSYYKLEVGDVIANIGNYPALNLKHEEALNIIRMFDVTLPLVIQREQSFFSQSKPTQVKTNVWRPPSVSSYEANNSSTSAALLNNAGPTSPRGHLPPMLINTFNNNQSNNRNANLSNLTYSSYSSVNDLTQARQAYNQQAPTTPTSLSSPFQYQHAQSLHSPTSTDQSYHSYQAHQPQHHTSTYHQSPSSDYYSRPQASQQLIKIASPPPAHPQSVHHHQIGSSIPPPPPSMSQQSAPAAYIPPAPPMPSSFSPSNTYQSQRAALSQQESSSSSSSYSRAHETRETSKSSGAVPDALLKAMYGSPGGKKPFTYTPGGLDLSHIRDSARVKRHEHNQQLNHHHHHQQQQQQQFARQTASSFENNDYPVNHQHQSYHASYQPVVAAPPPPPPPHHPAPSISSYQQPSFQPNLTTRSNSSSGYNFDSVPSTPTKKVPTYQPPATPTGFNITPDKLVRPKPKEGGNLMNQSFSFKMLNRWIEESESNTMVSKKDEEENSKTQQQALQKSAVIKAIEEEEKRGGSVSGNNLVGGSVRKMSESYNSNNPQVVKVSSAQAVPSKVFQYIDRALSSEPEQFIRRRQNSASEEQTNFVNRVPAREREQEPGAPKYKGTHIPSKSFKYLQYLTQNESVIDNNSLNNNNNNYSANSSGGTSSSNISGFNPAMATHMQNVAQTALNSAPVLQTASIKTYQPPNSKETSTNNNNNSFDNKSSTNYNHSNYIENDVSNFTQNVYSQPNHTDNGFNPSFANHTINKNSVTFAQNNNFSENNSYAPLLNAHNEQANNDVKHESVPSNSNLSLNDKDEQLVKEANNEILDESLIENNKESLRSEDECATTKDASSIELINTLSCESENPNSNNNNDVNNADNSESFLELPTSCTSIVNNETINTNINFSTNLNASAQSNETVEVVNNVETTRSVVVEKQAESQTVIQDNESSQQIVESSAQKETISTTTTTTNHETNEENVAEDNVEHANAINHAANAIDNSDEQPLSASNENNVNNAPTQNAQEAVAVETSEF